MSRQQHIPPDRVEPFLRAALGSVSVGSGPSDLALDLLDRLARVAFHADLDVKSLTPLDPAATAEALPWHPARARLVQLMVVLELLDHPTRPEVVAQVQRYANALDVKDPMVNVGRRLANDHLATMYADIMRNSYYTAELRHELFHGHFWEMLRSKLAYTAIRGDQKIATKWQSLGDHPEGTLGRMTYEFYRTHNFPLPGERHGIGEIGAHHDFVHILADYPTDPEGEIDVFAFIDTSSDDPKAFSQLVLTLGLFQNASIHHVAGKQVTIARADTLADPGATTRFADALQRGTRCTVDVLGGIDHFALAGEPVDALRERFSIAPKADLTSPGALDRFGT